MNTKQPKLILLASLAVITLIGAATSNANAEHKRHWDIHDRWDRGDDRHRHGHNKHKHGYNNNWRDHHRHDRWCKHNHGKNSSVVFSYSYYTPPPRPVYVTPAAWDDSNLIISDNSGYRANPTRTNDGRYCREYQNTVKVGGNRQSSYGTACQQPDGSWEIVD